MECARRRTVRLRQRLASAGLAVAFLVSIGFVEVAPATATDWTRQIAATRASQIYYESVMRGADQQLKNAKRGIKQTQRKLKSGKRHLKRARERRTRLVARYRQTKQRFKTAKRELTQARASVAVETPDLAGAILVLSTLAPPDQGTTIDTDRIPADAAAPDWFFAAQAATPPADVSVEDVARARHQMKAHRHASRKAARKWRRTVRNTRSRARTLASLKRQQRAAIGRRESAEAALGGRIIAMSQLAHRRVAKKTKARPNASSGFGWPARGRLAQTYGCTGFVMNPPSGSCRHFHDGIDIAGYRGSAIRAAAIGVVSYVGWNPWDKEGRAFMIDGGPSRRIRDALWACPADPARQGRSAGTPWRGHRLHGQYWSQHRGAPALRDAPRPNHAQSPRIPVTPGAEADADVGRLRSRG